MKTFLKCICWLLNIYFFHLVFVVTDHLDTMVWWLVQIVVLAVNIWAWGYIAMLYKRACEISAFETNMLFVLEVENGKDIELVRRSHELFMASDWKRAEG